MDQPIHYQQSHTVATHHSSAAAHENSTLSTTNNAVLPGHQPSITLSDSPSALPRLFSSIYAFFNAGINDGSLGALIPYILLHYHIGTGSIAITYGSAFAGWVFAALTGTYARIHLGGGGTLLLGGGLQFLGQAMRVWDPPFSVFCISFFFVALGQAFQDSQANTFVSTVKVAHRWLGVIHASYAAGCVIGPLIATAISTSNPEKWVLFYWAPFGMGIVNMIMAGWVFRRDIKFGFRKEVAPREGGAELEMGEMGTEREQETPAPHRQTAFEEMRDTIKEKNVWKLSLFFFFYLGTAITAGGWLVEYLVTVRHNKLSIAGYIPTAYYGGTTLGRLFLAEPTHRFGEKRMLLIYTFFCLILQIIFWRVNNLVADSIVITLMGFLLGPYFAAGISVATKLLPSKICASALSLIFVIALAGGSIFPALAGLIAQKAGVSTLQPILIGLLVALGLSWALVPMAETKRD